MPKLPLAPKSNEDKLDRIVTILEMMNRRDRARTVAGFFRGLLNLIPLLLVIWSAWYFYAHGDELLKKVAAAAAEQAAAVTEKGSSDFMKQIQQYMPK